MNENSDSLARSDDSDRLVDLAKQMDAEIDELSNETMHQLPDSGSLSDIEQNQLRRIKGALAFLNDVRASERARERPADQKETVAGSVDRDTLDDRQQDHRNENPGTGTQQLGRFRLGRLLGKGGFAKVWLARDPKLNRDVALKLLNPSFYDSSEALIRFQREARAAAILGHPNIVPLYESGSIGSDHYIVSEYCDGETLEQWLAKQKEILPPGSSNRMKIAARIVATLADAVQHAHQREIVHRDLKPANILIADGDDSIKPGNKQSDSISRSLRITDFGLARSFADDTEQNYTREGAILGTPAYMSPEQARGSTDITRATDIYSLGVILFELLTGRVPVLGDSPVDTLIKIRQSQPVAPRSVNRQIPVDLDAICQKCMKRKPADRYESAWDLAADLNRWLSGQPVQARRPTIPEKLGKWIIRNPALTTAIAAITVGLVTAGIQWKAARDQATRARRNVAFAQETISSLGQRLVGDSTIPADIREEFANRAVALQNRLLQDEPEDQEVVYQTAIAYLDLAMLLFEQRNHQPSLDALDQAEELFNQLPASDKVEAASVALTFTRVRTLIAMDRNDEALQVLTANTPKDQKNLPLLLDRQSHAYWMKGELDQARTAVQKAILIGQASDKILILKQGDLARFYLTLGQVELDAGNLRAAEQALETALEYQTTVISQSPFHESMEETMGRIEYSLGKAKDPDLASEEIIELLDQSKARFKMLSEWNTGIPRYHEQFLTSTRNLASALVNADQFEKAESSINQLDQEMDPDDPDYVDAFGMTLLECQIQLLGWLSQNGDANPDRISHCRQRCEFWLTKMQDEYPGDPDVQQWQDRFDEIR